MRILCLTLPILIFSSTLFGYTCYFRQYTGHIRLINIQERKVYNLFTRHITSHGQNILSIIRIFHHIDDRVDHLGKLLDEHQETISSERSDVQQLTQLLDSGEIDWIGIEDARTEIALRFIYNQRVQDYLGIKEALNILNSHPNWNLEKTDQLLYLVYGADLITYAKNPELFAEVRFIPLEKEHLLDRAEELFREISIALNTFSQLKERGMITDEKSQAVKNFGLEALGQRGLSQITGDNLIDSDELEDFLKTQEIEYPEVVEAITPYVSTINAFMTNGRERNEEVVTSVLNQSGNGIIIMGGAHKAIIEDRLRENCLNLFEKDNSQSPISINTTIL